VALLSALDSSHLALIGSCAVMSAPKYDEQQAMTKRIRPEATPIPHGISSTRRSIVDAHMHLYDSRAVRYSVFEHRDPTFEALVGDYSRLPRTYGLDDYLGPRGCATFQVSSGTNSSPRTRSESSPGRSSLPRL